MISPLLRKTDNGVRLSGLIAPCFYDLHRKLTADEAPAEIWLKGGRGSTKSSFASIEIILGLLRDPCASAIIYRKVAATLRESVYEQMLWAIDRLGLNDWFKSKLMPLEIACPTTGQRILFKGADDPGKSKSIKLSKGYFKYLWFEELSEFSSMQDIRTIKASIFRGEAPGVRCITLYSYNPPVSARNWVNAEALIPRDDREVHHSTYMNVPEKWLGENFLNEASHLRQTNERAWRHMYMGEITGTGGQVFSNLRLRPVPDSEIETLSAFYNGLDFGFAVDPDALIRIAYEPRTRRLFLLDEFCSAHTPTDVLAEKILAVAGNEIVRCDCAEPRMIRELRSRGVQAIGVKKGPGSVTHGIRWLQELREIIIDPGRCPCAAREFSAYEYIPDNRGGFCPGFPDRDNHLIDAARYAMESAISKCSAKSFDRREIGL